MTLGRFSASRYSERVPRLSLEYLRNHSLARTHPRLAREWHPSKNRGLTPRDVTYGSQKKVWWQCPRHRSHNWEATIGSRSLGSRCPFCSGERSAADTNLARLYPEIAREWDPTKNGDLSPRDVTPGSGKRVWWRCSRVREHVWITTISHRVNGSGCNRCANKSVGPDNNLAVKFPDLAKEWHPTKNRPQTPRDVVPGSGKKVWWRCPQNRSHIWEATVINRTGLSSGCPFCSGRRPAADTNLARLYPKIAKEWHPTKNGDLSPSDVTAGSNRKVWWKCEKREGHEWEARVADRVKGSGCPKCRSSTSRPELRLRAELEFVFPKKVSHREILNGVEIDVYIRHLKTGVEYDGAYWHRRRLGKDRAKNRALEDIGIRLVRVRERSLQKIRDWDVMVGLRKTDLSVAEVQSVLRAIVRGVSPSKGEKSRVKRYLRRETYANQARFLALLEMLPSPDPDKSLQKTHRKLAKEWHPTQNGSLTPWDVTPGSRQKVWWRCSRNPKHEWNAVVSSRALNQRGCPKCSGASISPERSLARKHRSLAKEWHPTKNQPLTPKDVSPGSNMKVWWRCSKEPVHEWEAVVAARVRRGSRRGSRCPYCAGRRPSAKHNLAGAFPKIAREWHPSRNRPLTPSDVTPGSNKKIVWRCSKNRRHLWIATICDRTRTDGKSTGCPECWATRRRKHE